MIKIYRRKDAPKSLAIEKEKKSGSWRGQDVVDALKEDFYDKCYICGLKEPQSPEIEHRIPHHGNRDLMFDWNNLFWACSHCNSVKNKGDYDSGIIDCCVEDPEDKLSFIVIGEEVSVIPRDKEDNQAVLTATLMRETFMQEDTPLRTVKCKRIRDGLLMEMKKLYNAIEAVENQPDSETRRKILEALLSREAAFAEFKRYYYKEYIGELPS